FWSLSVPFIFVSLLTNVNISEALPFMTATFISFKKFAQKSFLYCEAPTATGSNIIGVPTWFAVFAISKMSFSLSLVNVPILIKMALEAVNFSSVPQVPYLFAGLHLNLTNHLQ